MLEGGVFEAALGAAQKFLIVNDQVKAVPAVETEEGASLGSTLFLGGVIMRVDAEFLQRGNTGIVDQLVHALDVGMR